MDLVITFTRFDDVEDDVDLVDSFSFLRCAIAQ